MTIAAVFAIASFRRAGSVRGECCIAAAAFAAFGVSDLIEVRTGAWWKPWWLLAWKGVCVAVFAVLLWRHYRNRRSADRTNPPAE